MLRNGNTFDLAPNLPSKSSRVTVPSTYSHQCFPSVETGISQLDHLQARWMQTQATTGGVYCRLKVVRWRLTSPARKRERERKEAVSAWTDTARSGHPSSLGFFKNHSAQTNSDSAFSTRSSRNSYQPGAPGPLLERQGTKAAFWCGLKHSNNGLEQVAGVSSRAWTMLIPKRIWATRIFHKNSIHLSRICKKKNPY